MHFDSFLALLRSPKSRTGQRADVLACRLQSHGTSQRRSELSTAHSSSLATRHAHKASTGSPGIGSISCSRISVPVPIFSRPQLATGSCPQGGVSVSMTRLTTNRETARGCICTCRSNWCQPLRTRTSSSALVHGNSVRPSYIRSSSRSSCIGSSFRCGP